VHQSRVSAFVGISSGVLAIAATYSATWGSWLAPPGSLAWPSQVSLSLAQFSGASGWYGDSAAVMVAGGALLIVTSAISLICRNRSSARVACATLMAWGSLVVLLASIKSAGMFREGWSLGPAIWLCLVGGVLGALGTVGTFMSGSDSHQPSTPVPSGTMTRV
jgi:hypothetical protein